MPTQVAALCERHSLEHITFPLSAVHTMQAPGAARSLLALSPRYTLTLWGEADAPVGKVGYPEAAAKGCQGMRHTPLTPPPHAFLRPRCSALPLHLRQLAATWIFSL